MSDRIFVVQTIADGAQGYPHDEVLSIGVCSVDLDTGNFDSVYDAVLQIEPKYLGKPMLDCAESKGLEVALLYTRVPEDQAAKEFKSLQWLLFRFRYKRIWVHSADRLTCRSDFISWKFGKFKGKCLNRRAQNSTHGGVRGNRGATPVILSFQAFFFTRKKYAAAPATAMTATTAIATIMIGNSPLPAGSV